ncbi:cytochrome P450 [Crucibulum laeve]|uniref:Cytochrome P450 n=1 Tax=Crucibulum laeve TaxID=68775 RepID=A0A5C3LUY2_9AGAR|nr:cytochrome P450 [Crucibulum laeve]
MIEEGYEKHKGGAFRLPGLTQWIVVFNSPKLVEELRKAPDDLMSFTMATEEVTRLLCNFNIHWELISQNEYHLPIIRNRLTQNLDVMFPELHDEIVASFQDNIPLSYEWKNYPVTETFINIIGRTSNRAFVGLPLCRNQEFLEIGVQFAYDVMTTATILYILPPWLRPIVASMLTAIPNRIKHAEKVLTPVIEDYREQKEHETEVRQSKVFLSWILDEAKVEEQSTGRLANRILVINFSSIHTTTNTFNQALLHLAATPQYLRPLRDEIEQVTKSEGWTKAALDKMRHLDSFCRETQRLHPLTCLTSPRKALQDHTFGNNTFIPKGSTVWLPSLSTMKDEEFYPNAKEFDPFRFSRVDIDQSRRRRDMVSTSPEFLPFGHGKHVCPGRFFASNEVKLIMAHLIMTYDVKMEIEGVCPADFCIGVSRISNPKAKVMFRKRAM